MRVRTPFAAAFLVLLLLSAFGSLLPHNSLPATPTAPFAQSDKILHLLTFFFLTITFYFILDTTRRRVLHFTLSICTLGLGLGSEVIQGLLPNGRNFDILDVAANVTGSLAAVGIAALYQRRAAERRRRAKYSALTGEGMEGDDVELGTGPAPAITDDGQETGVVAVPKTVEQELDNWDENAVDEAWDEDDDATTADTAGMKMTPASSSAGDEDIPKKLAVD